jgi:Leucine-rich repeat (LRR) protein
MKLYKSLAEATKENKKVQALKVGVKGEEFPQEILNFSHLEELYLEGSCRVFPSVTPEWSALRVLSIKWPCFRGDLSGIFRLPRLENLKIIETPLKSFVLPLGHVPSPLRSLTIKDCGLKDLPPDFPMLGTLNELNLSGNNLTALPETFAELKNMKRLNLDHNQFRILPDIIQKMNSLRHLSIDQNLFSEDEKARIQRLFHIWPL